ncbi:radical SAM protein [Nanoarchaeota archaeon]
MEPRIVEGWDIPKSEYLEAHTNDRLVKLLIELSNVCNLSCSGCFTNRVEEGWNSKTKKKLSDELHFDTYVSLFEEAAEMGVRSVDIVGSGEPTLDPRFKDILEVITGVGMRAVVFTHGATPTMQKEDWYFDRDISFFLKMWSLDSQRQNEYVGGYSSKYSEMRTSALYRLVEAGFSEGKRVTFDGIAYRTTKLGGDVLVRNTNADEISDVLRFCRETGIMPLIKTYIPEGPTRIDQQANREIYSEEELRILKEDEISPENYSGLIEVLARIDREEFGIPDMKTFYPQGSKCTQSMATLHVTVTGDIRACVGTHNSYGTYKKGENMLFTAVQNRKETVGFGCVPRLEEIKSRNLSVTPRLIQIYGDGLLE